MVGDTNNTETARLFDLLSSVVDPEIPVLTLQDLGVLRDISIEEGEVKVTITPTYAGCPAMETMRADIEATMAAAGYEQVKVQQKLSPAWTTDWMSQHGRDKLRAYGIAPPDSTACGQSLGQMKCPQCNSAKVKLISEFGSTACKALYQCQDCREPFDYFKCI
ncbi:MAG: phenylacetate-CoA oxygenase subunit PaaJ [Xanthomonadales bacterium]|nr:phenylacetate-CoA oxygenase subunit PaaJ [Xanthomonadales bacterium]